MIPRAFYSLLLLALFAPAATGQQPAFRADEFTDFVGINGAPVKTRIYEDGPFKGMGRTFDPQVFYDLGIRHYRMALKYDLTLPDQPQQVEAAYRRSGARALMLIDHNKVKPEEVVGLVKQYPAAAIGGVEGPNELNNKFPPQDLNIKYGGKTDEAAGALYMDAVYRALKADPATRAFPVVAFTSIFSDYRLARPHAGFDFANMHSYQGYNVPSASLLTNETRFNHVLPPGATIRPFMPTECGYNVEADAANGTLKTGSTRAQALNVPMLLAEYFRHGIRRAYLFAIQNADGYGLLESDLVTKRPSYFALKNLLAEVRDAAWDPATLRWQGGGGFAPRALRFSLEGAPASVHTLTLQKASGEWVLLVWNEVRNFDESAKRDLVNAPVPVFLRLPTAVAGPARTFTQNDAGGYDVASVPVENGGCRLQVPASVMLVKLRPADVANGPAPASAAPRNLTGSATENRVQIQWEPGPGTDADGYLVFRNEAFLSATREPRFTDASPWVRPGLGYRYAVQAFDRAGRLSPRAEAVIQTADKRPDLVIASVEVPEPKAGDGVRFRGVLQNVGAGATPFDVDTGLSFFVDGAFTSWATTGGRSLAPSESIVLEATGGPSPVWRATAGAHVLSVKADDINRVVGEASETNNDADRSFTVDVNAVGTLRGESDAAPFAFNLSREGTRDWAAWGGQDKGSVTRKAAVANVISAVSKVGEGHLDVTGGAGVRLTWSDGAQVRSQAGTNAGLWVNHVGSGFEFSVPAGVKEQVLKVVVGGIEGARGKFVATLGDGSAPDYVSRTWNGNAAFDWAAVPGDFSAVYTLRFRAAARDQRLTVRWTLDGEPNRFLGQVRLQAAALSGA